MSNNVNIIASDALAVDHDAQAGMACADALFTIAVALKTQLSRFRL